MKKLTNRLILFALALMLTVATASANTPRYIFYIIGDGMGMAPVMAAETYNRMVLKSEKPLLMTTFPAGGSLMTYSASSPVTDSAAAGTALSTGFKTRNGMIGMDADTVSVTSVARYLKDAGYGIGIVTNCAADDATPAAFYAHVPNRKMFYEIGLQAAASGYDFICGAGMRGGKDNDMWQVIEGAGYEVLRGAEGAKAVTASKSDKIMLLNPEGYGDPSEMGFVIDGVGSDGIGLTLEMAMDACMQHLERTNPQKFFMMVEGGLIDHALHGDDGSNAVLEVLNLQACIAKAYDFYLQHPDETLIIITADHDTGGMSTGCAYTGYNAYPENVDYQKQSKGAFSDYCEELLKSGKTVTWEEMKEILKEKWGLFGPIPVKKKAAEELKHAFKKTFIEHTAKDEKGLYKTSSAFAAAVAKVYSNATGWGFTTASHTGNPVPVFAIGVGAENFGRMLNNTQVAPAIHKLALPVR